jgi:hypothetical protein
VPDVPASARFPAEVSPTFVFKPIPQSELLVPLIAKVPPELDNAMGPALNQTPSLDVEVPLIVRLPAVLDILLVPRK